MENFSPLQHLHPLPHSFNEKPSCHLLPPSQSPSEANLSHLRSSPLSSATLPSRLFHSSQSSSHSTQPFAFPHSRTHIRPPYARPRALRILNLLRSCLPILMYILTSLGFLIAIALYRDEVFTYLDELSHWLRADEQYGYAVMFLLIFITTFPPIPLYSTLIILSGYTFGPWTGAIISYFAALTGALTVFIISRSLLRDSISRWLASYTAIKRVVRAIDKRPKLLFLIRLAPYPYNVMNCLLAASPTLTLHTYTVCTALSLFKVIIHTSLGASVHSFKDFHHDRGTGKPNDESGADSVARMWTIIGILLCIVIFVYLSIIARRAVDDELEEEDQTGDNEETEAFLSPYDQIDREALNAGNNARPEQTMVESPFRTAHQMVPFQRTLEHLDSDGWYEQLIHT
ncbi:hypothetical protein AMATHDRAFT_56459 [Amanita thiersii Skay4041]|uniref:Golgi apparatus membrane protein TVP38 n=1 Tax=Amanita thiersii Skay4041 TaxID=703135 RepID=A0A2A9NT45_9AGAR|nr:hypothetical protein AMATHDRAFT_56459 [Amanita thiersii Skay4041]